MPNRLPLLFLLLLLSGLLLAAGGAHGAVAGPVASTSAFEEEEFEGFEAEAEEEAEGSAAEIECEIAREEAAEGELDPVEADEICAEVAEEGKKKKKGGSASVAPVECLLRSAHAHAALDDKTHKLKLTIGYTTYEPVGAKIEIGHIAKLQRHLGRSGVIRIIENLGDAKAPKRVVVRLAIPASPAYCGKYATEKVRVH